MSLDIGIEFISLYLASAKIGITLIPVPDSLTFAQKIKFWEITESEYLITENKNLPTTGACFSQYFANRLITESTDDITLHSIFDDSSMMVDSECVDIDHDFLIDCTTDTQNQVIGAVQTKRSCLLYTSPSPRDATLSRMPSSA